MNFRTLLVSAFLFAVVCGGAYSQPQNPTTPSVPPPPSGALPPADLVPSVVSPPTINPPLGAVPAPAPGVLPVTPSVPPPEKFVEELLNDLERVQAQKAELEKKEQELKSILRKRMEKQSERMQKLGVIPKDAEHFPTDNNKTPARYPFVLTKNERNKDKHEVVILLLPKIAPGNPLQFATADRDLAAILSRLLTQSAQDANAPKPRIVTAPQVEKLKKANPDWKNLTAVELGKKLHADVVLQIELDKMRLYQPGSLDNIYEGRADVYVEVFEVGKEGEPTVQYPIAFAYPRTGVLHTISMSESKFKSMFLESLAEEIARMHVDFLPDRNATVEYAPPKELARPVWNR